MTKLKEEADFWVACLVFLQKMKTREQLSQEGASQISYFSMLRNTMQLQTERHELIQEVASSSSMLSESANRGGSRGRERGKTGAKEKQHARSKSNSHKFSNINARAFNSVFLESKIMPALKI
jgi:hypothetical protein